MKLNITVPLGALLQGFQCRVHSGHLMSGNPKFCRVHFWTDEQCHCNSEARSTIFQCHSNAPPTLSFREAPRSLRLTKYATTVITATITVSTERPLNPPSDSQSSPCSTGAASTTPSPTSSPTPASVPALGPVPERVMGFTDAIFRKISPIPEL